jgi:hypothetical protein
MISLDRLLALVNRTRLPTLVQSSDSGEPCVVLPLSVYEQLAGGMSEAPTSPLETTTLSRVEEKPSEPQVGLRLQDLLQSREALEPVSRLSATLPQVESLEDYFVFEGEEMRILPK